MSSIQEFEASIKELKKLTGLNISIQIDENQDVLAIAQKIGILNEAYKEKTDKDFIIRRWLTGDLSSDEFFPIANRFHLTHEEKRLIYIVDIEGEIDESILQILRHSFPDKHHIWIIPLNKSQLIIVYRFTKPNEELYKEIAYQITDILNSELYMKASISYSSLTTNIDQLPNAYQEAILALEVGKAFYSDQIVYSHNQLGIGRLLFGLPVNTCKAYINECLGSYYQEDASSIFQPEIRHTVNSFLKNNLNIAETARQLHMHRNTLLYRLEQIQNESGLDIRKFDDAMKYKVCSMLVPYIKD